MIIFTMTICCDCQPPPTGRSLPSAVGSRPPPRPYFRISGSSSSSSSSSYRRHHRHRHRHHHHHHNHHHHFKKRTQKRRFPRPAESDPFLHKPGSRRSTILRSCSSSPHVKAFSLVPFPPMPAPSKGLQPKLI